jgi:hypothetical protein
MADDTASSNRILNVRMSQADMDRIKSLRDWLQERKGRTVRVSQKTVILEALEELEKRRKELDRQR